MRDEVADWDFGYRSVRFMLIESVNSPLWEIVLLSSFIFVVNFLGSNLFHCLLDD